MADKPNKLWSKLSKVFNPLKSPLIYFLVFFALIPPLTYAALRPSYEEGKAAEITVPYAEFVSPADGQDVRIGESIRVNIKYSTIGCKANLRVLVDGNEKVKKTVRTKDTPGYENFNWSFKSKGEHKLEAFLFAGADPARSVNNGCVFDVADKIRVNVLPADATVDWRNPSQNGQRLSGNVTLRWQVDGASSAEIADLDYQITLASRTSSEREEGRTIASVFGSTVIGQGSLSDVCQAAGAPYPWICSHSPKWDTTQHSNGEYKLTITLTSSSSPTPSPVAADSLNIIIDNENEKPVCDSISIVPSSIDSGDTVKITAKGNDPDGGALTKAQIRYGNGKESGELNVSNDQVSKNYSGYKVSKGTKTFTATARFKDNEGEWSEYGECRANVKVTAKDGENTCPYISSSPLTSVRVGSTYSYTLTAEDPDGGDTVIKQAIKKPGWTSFDADSGVLSGTPTAQHAGVYSVVLKIVTQDGRCEDTQAFSILVYEDGGGGDDDGDDDGEVSPGTSVAPTVTIIYPTEEVDFYCGSSTIEWSVEDDGEIVKIWIEYSQDLENWTSVAEDLAGDATTYDWDVCRLEPGTYYVRVWAEDDDGIANAGLSEPFEIVNGSEVSAGPEITNPSPEPETETSDATPIISADFEAADSPVDTAVVVVTVDEADVTSNAVIEADGFSYEPSANLSLGEHTVYVKVADEKGREAERTWTFTITEEEKDTVSFLGMELPRWWVSVSALICGILALLLLIILAVMKLMALSKRRDEEEGTSGTEGGAEPGAPSVPGSPDAGLGKTSWEPETSTPATMAESASPEPPSAGQASQTGASPDSAGGQTKDYKQL